MMRVEHILTIMLVKLNQQQLNIEIKVEYLQKSYGNSHSVLKLEKLSRHTISNIEQSPALDENY